MKAGYEIIGIWKETGSSAKDDRAPHNNILAVALAREIDMPCTDQIVVSGHCKKCDIVLYSTIRLPAIKVGFRSARPYSRGCWDRIGCISR